MRRKKDRSNGITALYERLSRDDDNAGESNSIVHQKQMLEDYFQHLGDLEQCFKRYATNRTCSFYLTNEVDTFPDPLRKDLLCHPRLFSVICDLQAQSDIAFWKLRLHNITS